jgi:hypothetical protein
MTKYMAFDANTEVSGQAMMSFIMCIKSDKFLPILKKHCLDDVRAEYWYPMQKWLDVCSEIDEQKESMIDFVTVGIKLSETAFYPENINSVESVLGASGFAYQMNHRNGYAGEITVTVIGEHHVRLSVHIPYPPDMTYGTLYGSASRFLPPNSKLKIRRRTEDKIDIYDVTW